MHPYGLICALLAQAQVKLISHKRHDTFRQGIVTDRVEVLELKVAFVMFSLTTAGSRTVSRYCMPTLRWMSLCRESSRANLYINMWLFLVIPK